MSEPSKAFILAAGLGTRMRPLTNERPKPMVEINGRSLIWHILDKLRAVHVHDVVVNTHYFADMLHAHMEDYMRLHPEMHITMSYEEEILDTGGGIVKALPYFKDEAFYVIAGDAYWEDINAPVLGLLAEHWVPRKMDVISWMQPVSLMNLTTGVGDYDLLDNGLVRRSLDKSGAYMWTNIRINAAHIYKDKACEKFSVLPILDSCEKQQRYFGIEVDSIWHHISTPEDLGRVDAAVREK